jgi:hypothetical protein
MTEFEKMIDVIARDAYEGARERELKKVFMDYVKEDLNRLTEEDIVELYNEIIEA